MRELLRTIAPLLNELPNELSITGHTDNLPFAGGSGGYSNWELSSDRANASRRELVAGGLARNKLLRVAGVADNVKMPDVADNNPVNRRIELLVLYPQVAESIRHPELLTRVNGKAIHPALEAVIMPSGTGIQADTFLSER